MKKEIAGMVILTFAVLIFVGCGGETTQTEETLSGDDQMQAEAPEYPTAEQKLTALNIMRLGQCIEQYIMDQGYSPRTSDIQELHHVLLTTEITDESTIFSDGWGNALVYEPDMAAGSRNYTIFSYGADGQPGPEPQVAGVVGTPEEDYIYSNGSWRQRNEGPMD